MTSTSTAVAESERSTLPVGHCVLAAGPAEPAMPDLDNQNALENDLNIWILMVIHGY